MKFKNFYSKGIYQNFTTKLAILSAWTAVFIPGHLYSWLIERSYSALLLVIAVLSFTVAVGKPRPNYIGRRNNIILLGLLLVTALYIFPVILTAASDAYEVSIRDIFDLFRYIVIGAIFVIMGNADPDRLRVAAEKLIFFSLSYSLIVLLLYLVDVSWLSDMIRWLYDDTKTRVYFPTSVRLSAPFENPNFLAFYVTLCLSYVLFFSRGKSRFILAALALIVLAATGSRSGWVAMSLLISGLFVRVLFGVFNTRRSTLREDVQFLIILILIILYFLWLLSPYLLESQRIQMVIQALNDGGLSHERNVKGRLDMIVESYSAFLQRPIFGWGPLKTGVLETIDNQFFLILARQGLVGFTFVISIMLYVFSGAVKFAHTREEKFGVFMMWLAVLVLLMTGAFLNNFRLFVLFIFFSVALTGKKMTANKKLIPPTGQSQKYIGHTKAP